jgi:AraC-like DNA-binding protein
MTRTEEHLPIDHVLSWLSTTDQAGLPANRKHHACGYEDVNHFIRVFRSQYSVSPGVWRKRHAKADMPGRN